ncbi:MAG: hypothetical protein Pg6C_16900 [Treponemataceae bacterium]|nr:MAG: hypothetical protein Pg6C_16900 [Treponemataceae bacterium]
MKLTIQKSALGGILAKLQGTDEESAVDTLEKAVGHKYLRRWMGAKGKWQYLYPKDLLHPIKALQSLFGFKEEKINEDYEKANIKKEYGADKKTFSAHVLEYFSNKLKWDGFFAKKENREKTAKPVKQTDVKKSSTEKVGADEQAELTFEAKPKTEAKKPDLNRSLMRKVWEMYNPAAKSLANSDKPRNNESISKEADNGRQAENRPGTGQGELPAGTPAVRDAGGEGAGSLNVSGGKAAGNKGESGGLPDESGGKSGGNLGERRGRSAIKAVREQVKELLASKTDAEMTEADKALLRQYEGAGGLAEKGASNHGTLYEFYTPQKVVDKVWSLVDKYNPNPNKEVIEPSAGTGRFAEGRSEHFNLFELDETSARIAGILHPEAEVKQGAFQELFMNGRTPKKSYDGKKYDAAVGNPPYGEYSGIYKGYGEGKEHSKIDEYFIDRTLDTLKEGGVLAMVVPSSFLRSKNSKAKEKIAGKARLLEAWRLPNGTFGTTGVGTDIIVLRKEPNNLLGGRGALIRTGADFSDNKYFDANENHIAGIETERIGRFGPEKYVSPHEGMTFDQSLDLINPEKIPVIANGEQTPEQAADEKVEVKESEAEAHQNRSEAMKGNDNAKKDFHQEDEKQGRKKKSSTDDYVRSIGKNMSADEYNTQYGVVVDKKDMPVWAVTNYDGKIDVARLSAKDREWLKSSGHFTHDAAGNWYSIANYASGNIYDKLDQLEKEKDELGAELYAVNKSILEAVKPAPKAAENIFVSPISDFAKEYKIADDEGAEMDLRDAFRNWAQVRTYNWGRGKRAKSQDNWNSDTSPISEYEIPPNISFNDVMAYIRQEPVQTDRATARDFDKETAKMEAAKKRDSRRECAERLFNRFIREGLPEEQRNELVERWNRRFNAVVNPDYTQIPTFVDGMNTHKGKKEFKLLPCQVKGISFLCNKGNGILAHEVGVGKTVQGEAATVNQIKTGRAKRPLVCVPKAVYSKWVKEFHQHFPDMVINELGNFSDKDIAKFKTGDTGLNIPEGTISVCTYEALQKVTFKDETITTDLINDMMDSQTIYDEDGEDQRSPKEIEEERNKMMEKLGRGAKAKEGALFWEETGFDCITVDEVHNFKNVFGAARAFSASVKDGDDQERQSNEFKGLTGGTSDRAMKLFAITQLIQKQNDGRNVFGLSATPFTNSPIEVYNMLSLVARNKLKELHIYNMYEFLAQFAEIKSEWSVTADGDIKQKDVMTHWKNLGALQNLITEYMDYVTADDADVIRPIKKEHLPELELTPAQKAIIAAETEYMTTADPKEDPGAVLKAINNMRLAALSPAAISRPSADYSKYEGWPKGLKLKPEDFVTSSPKLKFVCDSVTECYKQQPKAGQIIYLPRGVNDFVHVKEYLMKQGMPQDSIAFMSSKTTLDEKERIKMDFNDPDGKIKVIIGSETIKEGVSLNGNTTAIYNCMLGWNPTETIQVEGRAWRQGNKQGHVHVVYPLMADSIDSLMYQKYHEKASRIDEVWSFKGDTSGDVSDINPESLRFDLIKDPARKAKLIVGQKKEKITADRRIEEARYEVLYKDNRNLAIAEENLPEQKRDMDVAEAAMLKRREERDAAQKQFDKYKKAGWSKQELSGAQRDLDEAKWELEQATSSFRRERKSYKEIQDDVERYHAKFKKMGIRLGKVDEKLKEISANIQTLKQQEEAIENSYNFELENAKKELAAAGHKLPPLKEQTADNVKSIMGNLRPMDEYKEGIKTVREKGDTRSTKEIIREMDKNREAARKQTQKALSAITGKKSLLIMRKSAANSAQWGGGNNALR